MTFQERYRYNPATDLLGKGGFARVYRAKDVLLDRDVAIKIFNVSESGQYSVIEEIKKAIRLEHPNLLRYYDVAIVENTNALGEKETIQIGVMELATGGDLKQFAIRNPGSPVMFDLLRQVLSGLEYLHHRGIIHRDLKPQNILLVENDGKLTARICDFGISKVLSAGTNSSSQAIGTIEYMAPEQFSPAKYGINGKISTNVDLWSFGIMVHELVTQQPLFGQRSGHVTAEQIMNAILSDSLPTGVDNLPDPYKTIVRKCLVTDAKQRIQKANEIIDLLEPRKQSTRSADMETAVLQKPRMIPEQAPQETKMMPSAWKTELQSKPDTEIETTGPKARSKKKILYFSAAALLVVLTAVYFLFMQPKKAAAEDAIVTEKSFDESLKEKVDSNNYSGVMALLHNRLLDTSGAFKESSENLKYLPYYVHARLAFINDTSDIVPLIEECANAGDSECEFELALLHYEGRYVTQDYDKAFALLSNGARSGGIARSQALLANMYAMGLGTEINYPVAFYFYRMAAEGGNSSGMFGLAVAYQYGEGTVQSIKEAMRWYQAVIDKNDNPDAVIRATQELDKLKK